MAHSVSINCPSCGVAIDNTNAHTRSMSCPHCGNWVYFGSNGWESAGLFEHAIDAPSMLQLGKSGSLMDRRFTVFGRVRMSYSEGFWDEWWLEFEDGYHHWLEEDEGVYRLHKELNIAVNPDLIRNAEIGGNVRIEDESWFVTELNNAQVAGVEGSLPLAITPGETVLCIGVVGSGRKISIESAELDVQVYSSSVIRGASFEWD